MSVDVSLVRRIEAATAVGWPARACDQVGAWPVYLGEGRVGRTNSCWPLDDPGVPLVKALDAVEAVYRRAQLAPQVKTVDGVPVSSRVMPLLAQRDYRVQSTVSVMAADLGDQPQPRHHVELERKLTAGFRATLEATGEARDSAERASILSRVPAGSAFARIGTPDAPDAVGLGTHALGSLGIAAMRTRPEARRQGYARSIVQGLLWDGADQGLDLAWLQVDVTNEGAAALYRQLGFRHAYHYSIWKKDE